MKPPEIERRAGPPRASGKRGRSCRRPWQIAGRALRAPPQGRPSRSPEPPPRKPAYGVQSPAHSPRTPEARARALVAPCIDARCGGDATFGDEERARSGPSSGAAWTRPSPARREAAGSESQPGMAGRWSRICSLQERSGWHLRRGGKVLGLSSPGKRRLEPPSMRSPALPGERGDSRRGAGALRGPTLPTGGALRRVPVTVVPTTATDGPARSDRKDLRSGARRGVAVLRFESHRVQGPSSPRRPRSPSTRRASTTRCQASYAAADAGDSAGARSSPGTARWRAGADRRARRRSRMITSPADPPVGPVMIGSWSKS